MTKQWDDTGAIDNGLGFVLRRNASPTMFALALYGGRFIALLAFVFVLVGIAVTVGWIVKAI